MAFKTYRRGGYELITLKMQDEEDTSCRNEEDMIPWTPWVMSVHSYNMSLGLRIYLS